MGECRKANRRGDELTVASKGFAQPRSSRAKIFSYIDTIKNAKNEDAEADRRRKANKNSDADRIGQKKKSSFELYLSTIPIIDPIDRTVDWVLNQPEMEEVEDVHGTFFSRNHFSGVSVEELDYDTSVSRCESERGTHGRGTPPVREVGQPQLDDLFRKLQIKQERDARRFKCLQSNDGNYNTAGVPVSDQRVNHCCYPPMFGQCQQRAIKETLIEPKKLRADILHKNSYYYNQELPITKNRTSTEDHRCEWKDCCARFLSGRDLLKHVQEEHVSYLPLHISTEFQTQRQLICQWRNCKENRNYLARYKLLLHIQRDHCIDISEEQAPCRTKNERVMLKIPAPKKWKLGYQPQTQQLSRYHYQDEGTEDGEITEHLSGSAS